MTLVQQVGRLIGKYNPQAEQAWLLHFRPVGGGDERAQINCFLRIELGSMEQDTTALRECLIEDGTERDYLRHIERHVAPFVAQHGLPCWTK